MNEFGTRHITILLVCLGMVIVGSIGLAGEITNSHGVVAAVLAALVVVAFSLGRPSTRVFDR